ncbi:hypothetical protein WA026_000460 [Henosepilachna vigintioctopunctata]|uniref:Large ribosomal subunit protein mL62 n=1 Tax=Henosepilachna vigintioctopunctata TaxID=420089 RepID=A0AAW1UXM5_9CUCU
MNVLKSLLKFRNIPIAQLENRCYNVYRYNSFSSAISLRNLYPNSSLRLSHVSQPSERNKDFDGHIPLDCLNISYSRSSGPGGQNVNKVNTKVDVRFKIKSATWLSEDIKAKLIAKNQNNLTKDGYLVFRSDLTRFQQLNLADCLQKIRTLIRNCLKTEELPSEETIDRIRKRHEKATKERLLIKRNRSQIKSDRSDNIII